MHVIINIESLLKPSGGIGRYTRHLLNGLIRRDLIDSHSCFAESGWIDCTKSLSNHKVNHKAKARLPSLRGLVRDIPYSYIAYSYYKELLFRYQTRGYRSSIYHEPNYILKPYCGPTVTTVHDLSHLHYPQFHPPARVQYLQRNLPKTLKKAGHIITDSAFVRDELIQMYDIDEERITAIPLGVDSSYTPNQNDLGETIKRYNLEPYRYILSVATIEPRKNIEGILNAYIKLDNDLRNLYPLVIVGAQGWVNSDILKKINELETSNVLRLGYVPDNDLAHLYAGARAFVYVPFYEGFGLPPLEAMASGVPVITSDASSIPEVVGNASILVNPYDVDEIALKLECLLTDDLLRDKLIEDGLARSSSFSWDQTVERTISVYKKLAD